MTVAEDVSPGDLAHLRRARIGYATMTPDWTHPAYRRRFAHYAQRRALRVEFADSTQRYDVVVVHHSADLTVWRDYAGAPLVFDYNDSYLRERPRDPRRVLRGLAKFAAGQTRRLALSYTEAYRDTMRRAAAVVCSTEAQASDVAEYCANVHQVLDFWGDREPVVKQCHEAGTPVHLVWEGFPDLAGFGQLQRPFRRVTAHREMQLHLVTNVVGARFLNTVWPSHTIARAKKLIPCPPVFLYEWHPKFMASIVTSCDVALIPIDMASPFAVAKPANRLLQFWRLGMPVITSRTPEYARMARLAGVDVTCGSETEWEGALERYTTDRAIRQSSAAAGRAFVEREFSPERLCARWDRVMASVL